MSDIKTTIITFLGNIPAKKGDAGFIIAMMIIGYIIYVLISLTNSKKEILHNWGANRCNLSIIPIAGFITPIGKKKTTGIRGTYQNFVYCVDTISSSWAKILIEPFIILIHIAVDTFEGVLDNLLNMSDKFQGLHLNIFGQFEKYLKELKNIKYILLYVNEKLDSIKAKFILIIRDIVAIISQSINFSAGLIKDSFIRLLKIIIDIKTQLEVLIFTNVLIGAVKLILFGIQFGMAFGFFASFFLAWMGVPLMTLGVANVLSWIVRIILIVFLSLLLHFYNAGLNILNLNTDNLKYFQERIGSDSCFTDIKINMKSGENKLMSEIYVGEYLEGGDVVLGTMNININDTIDIYKYDGIEVTGSHLVFHKGRWDRVENIGLIKERKYVDKLYCLITKNNTIKINNVIFSDYNETSDKLLQSYINYYVMNYINKENKENNQNKNKENNQNKNKENNQNNPNLKEIIKHTYIPCISKDVYDKIINNNKDIYGFIKILYTSDIKLYRYCGNVLSGNMIVLSGGAWKRVWECSCSEYINDFNDKYLYNVMSHKNIINIDNNVTIRDFVETNSVDVNLKIDTMVKNYLNNN